MKDLIMIGSYFLLMSTTVMLIHPMINYFGRVGGLTVCLAYLIVMYISLKYCEWQYEKSKGELQTLEE